MNTIWNNTVIAQSEDLVEVEGNAKLPLASRDRQHGGSSDTHSACPGKGEASHVSLKVGDQVNTDAAWFYPQPKERAEAVAGRVAVWRGLKVQA